VEAGGTEDRIQELLKQELQKEEAPLSEGRAELGFKVQDTEFRISGEKRSWEGWVIKHY
jgi:hypothetical protein